MKKNVFSKSSNYRLYSHSLLGFMKLLDNYERSTGVDEKVTDDEIAENNAFLNAVLDTEVMKVKTPVCIM